MYKQITTYVNRVFLSYRWMDVNVHECISHVGMIGLRNPTIDPGSISEGVLFQDIKNVLESITSQKHRNIPIYAIKSLHTFSQICYVFVEHSHVV